MSVSRFPGTWSKNGPRAGFIVSFAAVFLCMMAGCGSPPPRRVVNLEGSALKASDYTEIEYLLAVGDELEVRFPYRPDLNEQVTVRPDGRVVLPLLDPIVAVDKTPEELQEIVAERYQAIAYDPTARDENGKKEYLIGVSDKLEIKFHYQTDFNDIVTVLPDGTISLALIKTVVAEGKTPADLEAELIERYTSFLKKPELVVIVREFTSDRFYVAGKPLRPGVKDVDEPAIVVRSFTPRVVYVSGEVLAPGFVRFQWPMTALQAIVGAGGTKLSGNVEQVVVLRKVGVEQPKAIFINLASDLAGQTLNDVALRPFDVVVVPKKAVAKLKDFLDQYLYDLVPALRNSAFLFVYDVNPPDYKVEGNLPQQ